MSQQEERQKHWARIVAKAWADEDYKKRLLANPHDVFKNEEGLNYPPEASFEVVEQKDDKHVVLVIPPPPPDEVGVEKLESRLADMQCCSCSG
ncbi:NHLP leader peptide family RiPP precursor [Dethiosulfatarculus sandiegensis]|uniref:Nitrile hydratase-like protein n=1 Tax=Dethiosulfatarculus sandiegensis TaxID=1429043 RepID=A0A0D2JEQ8_9BACT|nr:NHLP leader peptide family RiPP precursor [Dethiosulfatarculus sandiegensis]KIX14131.1 nitrile hydratase-like protein [Dethiosulfatarculus sandiegensis]